MAKSRSIHSLPLLDEGQPITLKYAQELEKAIDSDGCTAVTELYHICCVIHDLGYREGIDPWGHEIDRRTVDGNFRRCIQEHSKLGRFSPLSWIRWFGVRVGGYFLWRNKA